MENSLALVLALGIAACRGPIPCSDCDDAADNMPEGPAPDLPCGGADFLTDPNNCGSCSNVCDLWLSGTEWDAGICEDGMCASPGWSHCEGEASGATCSEICAGYCVPNGCAGHTALLFLVNTIDQYCGITPYATMDGSCGESIPWEPPLWVDDISTITNVMCCCG